MNPYHNYVAEFARIVREGKALPLGGLPSPAATPLPPNAPRVLIFAPHPDDEVIIGGLALRLRRELKWKVVNVAVTQGSSKARQPERWRELQACCDYIGFDLLAPCPNGLEGINLEARARKPDDWARSVSRIAEIVAEQKPHVICFPHDDDWNITHIGTHHLVVDALGKLGSNFSCYAVETEFWGAMDTPNLVVESSARDVTDLIAALSFHVGEVKRNPYHLRMPAWLMDNVRRGGELVGGQGGPAPDFLFATLYRLRRWQRGQLSPLLERGRFVSQGEDLKGLFDTGLHPTP